MGERAGKVLIGPGRPYDLILVCLLAAGAVLLSFYARDSPLTWTLGFFAVFFAPGYAITSALFPGNREILAQSFVTRREERAFNMTMVERIALAFGMSAVAMALAGTLLARVLSGLNLVTVGLTVVSITGLVSAYAVYRRSVLPPGDQFAVFTRTRRAGVSRRGLSRGEKGVAALSVAGLFIMGAVAVSGMSSGPSGSSTFTEFYIAGPDGNVQQLPQQMSPGQGGAVRVTVNSHLQETVEMRLTVSFDTAVNGGEPFQYPGITGPISGPKYMLMTISPGDQWSQVITFNLPGSASAGTHTVFFVLDDGVEVKTLWISITVTGGAVEGGSE